MADIKRILKKKAWTGRDLGILEVTNMCIMFSQSLEGKEPKPIVEISQLRSMIDNISDRQHAHDYNGYISIHEWLIVRYNIAQAYFQQAQLQFRTLEGYIERAILAEDVYSYVRYLPAIMTQSQYDAIRAERIEAQFKDETGEELTNIAFSLVLRAIDFYVYKLIKEPGKPNPLKAIKRKYVNQPVKSSYILSQLDGEPPADLTKWEIVESGLLFDLYGDAEAIAGNGGEEFYSNIVDFTTEFRELVTVILKDIDKKYFKGEAVLSGLPLTEWSKPLFTERELYEKDFYGERAVIESPSLLFAGEHRPRFNGVAILQEGSIPYRYFSRAVTDERGFYVEPEIRTTLSRHTLEGFFTEADEYAENVEVVEQSRKTFIASYYYLMGYNYSLELIGEYYDIPDVTIFQMDLEFIESRLDELNALTRTLADKIFSIAYSDKTLKEKKLQVLKDHFQPLEYKTIAIPDDNKQKARNLLKDFKAFQDHETTEQFEYLLCQLPEPIEDGEGAY